MQGQALCSFGLAKQPNAKTPWAQTFKGTILIKQDIILFRSFILSLSKYQAMTIQGTY